MKCPAGHAILIVNVDDSGAADVQLCVGGMTDVEALQAVAQATRKLLDDRKAKQPGEEEA